MAGGDVYDVSRRACSAFLGDSSTARVAQTFTPQSALVLRKTISEKRLGGAAAGGSEIVAHPLVAKATPTSEVYSLFAPWCDATPWSGRT